MRMLTSVLTLSVLLLANQTAQAALVVGDTFGLSMNFAPADQTSFEDSHTSLNHTFANGGIGLGASLFDPAVQLNLFMDENEITATNSIITLQVFGTDANGNLVNPVADGTLAANGNPFTQVWFDMGVFNAGTDLLTPNAPYVINSAFVGMISTAGEFAGTGSPGLFSDSPDGISTSVGFNIGVDVATADLNAVFGAGAFPTSGEFAGWQAQFDVTAVPEPSFAGVFLLAGVVLRRRNRS